MTKGIEALNEMRKYGVCLPKCEELKPLTRSPESWQYIEVEL